MKLLTMQRRCRDMSERKHGDCARCVLIRRRRRGSLLFSLVVHPVDMLLYRIQFLNGQKGASKHFIASKRSPLRDARKALCINATSGQNEEHFGTLCWRYGSSDEHVNFARNMLFGLDGQVWWRFRSFYTWPLRFADVVGRTGSALLDMSKRLYNAYDCCVDDLLTLKARG